MSVPEILRTIGENFQSSTTVKNVYGEPISRGGGGAHDGEQPSQSPRRGGGGGGRMSAMPAGALEITSAGSRFIAFRDWRKLASVVALSFALGFVVAARRTRSQRERSATR